VDQGHPARRLKTLAYYAGCRTLSALQNKEISMADVRIPVHSLRKNVLVSVPDGGDMTSAFNEAAHFVQTLEANNKIRDREAGVDPKGATHEVVKEKGEYRLRRFRFGGIA
jgi:hypothetical protein